MKHGANVLVIACPMCHSNLDMRRAEINNFLKEKIDIPVLYVTQALGMAIGLEKKELGVQRHFVRVGI